MYKLTEAAELLLGFIQEHVTHCWRQYISFHGLFTGAAPYTVYIHCPLCNNNNFVKFTVFLNLFCEH